MKTQSCMNRLLWITLLVIGLSGCSEESSSSEENTESGTIQDGDHADNATVIQLNSDFQRFGDFHDSYRKLVRKEDIG